MAKVLRRSARLRKAVDKSEDAVTRNTPVNEERNDSEDLVNVKKVVSRKRPTKRIIHDIDDFKVTNLKRNRKSEETNKSKASERSVKKDCKNIEEASKTVSTNTKKASVERSRQAGKSSALPSSMKQQASSSRIRRISEGSVASSSEDEWEEVEESNADDIMAEDPKNRTVEVTIQVSKQESEESKWAKFIRQQVNRKIRERQINCHKMHLLCYIAHLRVWARTLTRHEALAPLCLSLIPEGYVNAAEHCFDVPTAERFLKWFRSAFEVAKKSYPSKDGSCVSQVERLEALVGDHVYEDDKDLASILFLCIFALKQSTRLCLSCQPVPLKVDVEQLLSKETSQAMSRKSAIDSATSFCKEPSSIKKEVKEDRTMDESVNNKEHVKRSKKDQKCSSKEGGSPKEKAAKEISKIRSICNYWVEYWDSDTEQWICLNPLTGSVDMPDTIEPNVTPPMHYVLAVDDKLALRDLTARYARKFLSIDVRRLRVEQEWWDNTVKYYRSKNRKRERMEDVSIHKCLISRPKPLTVAEYKGHPLYVLEKDVLKFETIYPKDQKPLGQIRGLNIYPRTSLHHLEGSLNWMKHARMIKPGEQPIKIVKARPNHKVPPELREPKTLELYGYWQTEPYVPPKVVDGRIPRNEYGNIYMYKKSMLPEGCVHIRLDGLVAVARKLNVEHVPAVVGWEFHKCGNHPIIEGCVVLKKDEQALRKAWREFYEKKKVAAEKRRRERAKKNWRRLVKGVITMKKVRKKFLMSDRVMKADGKLEDKDEKMELVSETPIEDDLAHAWPRTAYSLPGASTSK